MIIGTNIGLAGKYNIKKYRGKNLLQEVEFDNLITNQGLNSIALRATGSHVNFCAVGTGTTPPASTDTALGAIVQHTSAVIGASDYNGAAPLWVKSITRTYQFAVGAVVGNITEVSTGYMDGDTSNANFRCFSRALILDTNGDPVAITVLPDEQLVVTWTLYTHLNVGNTVQSFDVSGVTYTATTRLARVNLFPGFRTDPGFAAVQYGPIVQAVVGTNAVLGDIDSDIGGTKLNLGADYIHAPYVLDSYAKSAQSVLAPTVGNAAGGIKGLVTVLRQNPSSNQSPLWLEFQTVLDKPIPKTADYKLTLNIQVQWGRYVP